MNEISNIELNYHFYTQNSFGNVIGHFLENYDKFEKASTENKIIILKKSSIPLGVLTGKQLINITLFLDKQI